MTSHSTQCKHVHLRCAKCSSQGFDSFSLPFFPRGAEKMAAPNVATPNVVAFADVQLDWCRQGICHAIADGIT